MSFTVRIITHASASSEGGKARGYVIQDNHPIVNLRSDRMFEGISISCDRQQCLHIQFEDKLAASIKFMRLENISADVPFNLPALTDLCLTECNLSGIARHFTALTRLTLVRSRVFESVPLPSVTSIKAVDSRLLPVCPALTTIDMDAHGADLREFTGQGIVDARVSRTSICHIAEWALTQPRLRLLTIGAMGGEHRAGFKQALQHIAAHPSIQIAEGISTKYEEIKLLRLVLEFTRLGGAYFIMSQLRDALYKPMPGQTILRVDSLRLLRNMLL